MIHARLGDGWQRAAFDHGTDRMSTTEDTVILRLVHYGMEGGEGVSGQGALAEPHCVLSSYLPKAFLTPMVQELRVTGSTGCRRLADRHPLHCDRGGRTGRPQVQAAVGPAAHRQLGAAAYEGECAPRYTLARVLL